MLSEAWKASCPACGAPIEFRLGGTRALVCPFCRASVVRGDGVLDSLGTLAELAPTTPVFALGDRGAVRDRKFVVLGRQQLDHGSGPWDEWFVAYDDESTGWLAQAQGRWFATSEQISRDVPRLASLSVDSRIAVEGLPALRVSELGRYRVISAEGELPVPISIVDEGTYADAWGPDGEFATIDDDGSDTRFFVGHALPPDAVVRGDAVNGPRPDHGVATERVRCPSCGADVPLHIATSVERFGCASCGALVDYAFGKAQVYEAKRRAISTIIPLGRRGVLDGEELVVVGQIRRNVNVSGVEYPWDELLLTGAKGFAWLTVERGHFTLLREVSPGSVSFGIHDAFHGNRRYQLFSSGEAIVTHVVGEFPWKVRVGEEAKVRDYIAPPYVLSVEGTSKERVHSVGRYVDAREVWRAFALEGDPPSQVGIGTCQPCPIPPSFFRWWAVLATVFFALAGTLGVFLRSRTVERRDVAFSSVPWNERQKIEPAGAAEDEAAVTILEDIRLRGPGPITLTLDPGFARSGFLEVEASLVHRATGATYDGSLVAEHYTGVDAEGPWVEDDLDPVLRFSQVPDGIYDLRLETSWDDWPTPASSAYGALAPRAMLVIRENDRSWWNFGLSILALGFPLGFALLRRRVFETSRWSESNAEFNPWHRETESE